MSRQIDEAQYQKYQIAKILADTLTSEFKRDSSDCLDYFLNSIVNSCKARNVNPIEFLAIIHNNLAQRILGPQMPEEFFQVENELKQVA